MCLASSEVLSLIYLACEKEDIEMAAQDDKFLIIDDHALVRRMVRAILLEQGASTVDEATGGADGLARLVKAAAEGKPYTTVFLDWSMPDMNGYEVLQAIRAEPRHAATAIIMLSAEADDTNIVKAMEAGATAYITKPFKPEAITDKLGAIAVWRRSREGAA